MPPLSAVGQLPSYNTPLYKNGKAHAVPTAAVPPPVVWQIVDSWRREFVSGGVKVPGAHAVSLADPTGQNTPTPHMRHSSELVITRRDAFVLVPPGHGSGAAEPSAQ